MKNNNILGTIIKDARIAKSYTIAHLSELSGISRIQIHNIETGKSIPRTFTLKLICDVLSIDFNVLLEKCDYSGYVNVENILGTTIRNARISKDYTQQSLSIKCNLSQRQICSIENGKSIPHISTLKKICAVLSLDFQELSKLSEKDKSY